MRFRRLAYVLSTILAVSACGDENEPGEPSTHDEANDAGHAGNRPDDDGGNGGDEDGEGSGGGDEVGDAGTGGGGHGGKDDGNPAAPDSVSLRLSRIFDGGEVISFGLPLPRGKVVDPSAVRVRHGSEPIAATVKPILMEYDANGAPLHPRALLVQFPASAMPDREMDIQVDFAGGSAASDPITPYASVSAESPDVIRTADRTIQKVSGENRLVETKTSDRTLFVGREPRVLVDYPKGYLASTGILGPQVTADEAKASDVAGLSYLSDAMKNFALSAMYAEPYAISSHKDAVVDPVSNYEGWLYDRCATFLTAYAHHGDTRFLRHALRSCSYYSSKIRTTGSNQGIFTGKGSDDIKYSHLRGLYAYYALTGDESALTSGRAIAELWYNDRSFVGPYRQGRLPGKDKLWTERLLGTSLEGLIYGHALTGETKYLTAFREMLATAYKHITGDANALAEINPGHDFPPQNCFIHSAAQHAEGNSDQPWCSGWMAELVIDPLLVYEEQTGDERVGEIFIRLARFLRDTGSAYFYDQDVHDDYFLKPSACYRPGQENRARRLVPLYGSGRRANQTRVSFGEYDDIEHCADATALTAAAIRALVKQGRFDEGGPIGPFASEGESFVAMHHELSACAQITFGNWTRLRRDPGVWSSKELEAGLSNPQDFIVSNKIGWPRYPTSPQRKLSWWFNTSMLQYGLLEDAGISFATIVPGQVQGDGCR